MKRAEQCHGEKLDANWGRAVDVEEVQEISRDALIEEPCLGATVDSQREGT